MQSLRDKWNIDNQTYQKGRNAYPLGSSQLREATVQAIEKIPIQFEEFQPKDVTTNRTYRTYTTSLNFSTEDWRPHEWLSTYRTTEKPGGAFPTQIEKEIFAPGV